MKRFWILVSILWLATCSGGGDSPTEPKEPAPVANFTASPTTLIQGRAVTFTSTSTGTITSYAWNVDADPAIEATTATYAHTYEEVGTYSITLTVTGPGGSNPKTVADMITVSTAAPTPTTATSQTVQEDGSTTISLTATDPNGQAVTFAITTDPTNGTATLSGTEITYTPNANFYGTDSFAYTASNGTYTSDPVTITITVEGEDDEPTTNDVSASTDEDTVVTVNLDATEIDGDNYSFSIISQPTNGTLGSVNGNQVEYTPNQDFNGTDTFTFEATDDRTFRRNVATATITVNAINDAPVANDVTASMNENKILGRYQPVTITLDATDVDGDGLTYFKQSDPSNGTLGTITNNQVVYTPTQDFNGEDTFIYKATDGNADSNGATVTVTVNAVNDAPVTEDQTASTDEDTALEITLTATDVDNDNLSFTIVSDVDNGTTSLSGTTVTYTPNQDWNGTDTFTFNANDGIVDSNISTMTITVASVNDAPVANDVTASMNENKEFTRLMPVTITLDATDVEGDDLTYSIVGTPSNGTLGSISDNQIIYTPSQDWNGEDTFTYKANDGTDDSNTATVTVTVTSVNDAPVTEDQSATTDEDTAVDITLTATDVENDNLTFTIVSDVSNGTTSLSGTTVTYTPDSNWNGTDTFTFKANDGTDDSNTSTVTITVASVNDAPVANDVTASTQSRTGNMRQAVTITLDATDVEGDDLTYSLISDVSNGTTSLSDNIVTYTPTANYDGTDTFTYKANDGTADSNTATGTITITDVNNAPIAANFEVNTNEELPINFTFNLTDPDGDENLTISLTENPLNGSLTQNTLTEYRYTPNTNFSGTDSFKYTVSDGSLTSSEATVTLKVSNPFYEILFDSNTQALSVLNKGSYIIIGNSDGGAKKYDSDMNEIWTIDDNNADNPVKIKEHSDGTIYLLSSDKIAKYSSSGSLEWGNDLNMDQARDFILVDDGIIIGGHKSLTDSNRNSYLATEKLSYSDGSSIWIKEHTAYSSTNWKTYYPNASIFQSSSGDIFFASDSFFMKFSSSQPIPSWVTTLSSGWVHQAAISPNDEIILIKDTGSQDSHYELYDLSGNLISSQRISNLMSTWGNGNAKKTLSSTISNDGVFYAVTYDGDWGGLDLIKYNGSDLTAFRRIELYSTEQIGWSNLGEMYYPASIDVDSETVIHIFNFKNNPFNSQSRVPLLIKTDLNGNILIP